MNLDQKLDVASYRLYLMFIFRRYLNHIFDLRIVIGVIERTKKLRILRLRAIYRCTAGIIFVCVNTIDFLSGLDKTRIRTDGWMANGRMATDGLYSR